MDTETTRDLGTRSRLGAAGRLQLDALAQYGGKGKLAHRGNGRYTLSVLRSPHHPDNWVDLHNVTRETLRNLERLGLVTVAGSTGAGWDTVELTATGRRVAELAA